MLYLNKENAFDIFVKEQFPDLPEVKFKQSVSVGSDIRRLLRNEKLKMENKEKMA